MSKPKEINRWDSLTSWELIKASPLTCFQKRYGRFVFVDPKDSKNILKIFNGTSTDAMLHFMNENGIPDAELITDNDLLKALQDKVRNIIIPTTDYTNAISEKNGFNKSDMRILTKKEIIPILMELGFEFDGEHVKPPGGNYNDWQDLKDLRKTVRMWKSNGKLPPRFRHKPEDNLTHRKNILSLYIWSSKSSLDKFDWNKFRTTNQTTTEEEITDIVSSNNVTNNNAEQTTDSTTVDTDVNNNDDKSATSSNNEEASSESEDTPTEYEPDAANFLDSDDNGGDAYFDDDEDDGKPAAAEHESIGTSFEDKSNQVQQSSPIFNGSNITPCTAIRKSHQSSEEHNNKRQKMTTDTMPLRKVSIEIHGGHSSASTVPESSSETEQDPLDFQLIKGIADGVKESLQNRKDAFHTLKRTLDEIDRLAGKSHASNTLGDFYAKYADMSTEKIIQVNEQIEANLLQPLLSLENEVKNVENEAKKAPRGAETN